MAQVRTFKVNLMPAKSDGPFVSIEITNTIHSEAFESSTIPEMLDKVKTIATTLGKGCAAFVRVIDGGRKPAGFDKATNRLYYNLDKTAHATISDSVNSVGLALAM